ncbi:hypothetical protein CYMTET_24744 [Cymbomonas tetramitiformis]|nr:hypothetical protein CYMTET_24744 [Cymbomonas tetramitiformis]
MLQTAVLEPNGDIRFILPTAASVAAVMGSFTEIYAGKRETFSFTIVWPCTIIYRPKIDGDRVHFVMTGIIKKNASGYVQWDSRQCYTGATLDIDPEEDLDVYYSVR